MGHAKDNSGVWGHSSAIGANRYFIFTVTGGMIAEKAFMGWAAAKSIGLKPLLDSYKGQTEQSFIVNYSHLGEVLNSGFLREQESILVLGACDSRDQRKATLHYLHQFDDDLLSRRVELGVLQSVSRSEALAQEAWSYDPSTKEYFICVDPDAIKLCPVGLQAAIAVHCEQHDKPVGDNQCTEELIKAYLLARRII